MSDVVHYPGPYEIEFALGGWTSPERSHVFRVNCIALANPAAGTLPSAISMQKKGGATATLDVVANQIWEYLRGFWNNSIGCEGYTLWKYGASSYAKDFISAGAVTNPLASAGAGGVAHQLTLTFRSALGNVGKLVLLETNQGGNLSSTLVPNAIGTPAQKLAAYALSGDSVVIARDDSFFVAALRDSRGENERIARKVYRGK